MSFWPWLKSIPLPHCHSLGRGSSLFLPVSPKGLTFQQGGGYGRAEYIARTNKFTAILACGNYRVVSRNEVLLDVVLIFLELIDPVLKFFLDEQTSLTAPCYKLLFCPSCLFRHNESLDVTSSSIFIYSLGLFHDKSESVNDMTKVLLKFSC